MNHTKEYAKEISKRLEEWLPEAKCALNYQTPYELLVATILSAQCTDVRVNIVTADLFKKYKSPKAFLDVTIEELENDIRSTGFYHNKAKSIRGVSKMLLEDFNGEMPKDINKLIQLPGVGRKTANVLLSNAYGIASGIVVDTHVTRLSKRMGLSAGKTAEKIERDLMGLIPKKDWIAFGHRVVLLGRQICTARKAKCDECPIGDVCVRNI